MYRQNNYKRPTSHKKKKIQKETQLIDVIKCYRKRKKNLKILCSCNRN